MSDTVSNTQPVSPRHAWLWKPNLIVFVSSSCIMVIELVAGRIIAPYVGVSLYTWTSVIGVVLAGISLGNYLGGRLADNRASLRLLGGIFCLGGLSSVGILAVDVMERLLSVESLTPDALSLIASIVSLTVILFFVPCTILGMISPIVAKLAVRDLDRAGRTVGTIYAAGSIGSIAGTFVTGFLLISWLGTHRIVWGVAIVLTAAGLFLLFAEQRRWLVVGMVGLALATVYAGRVGWLVGPCIKETNYYCIRIQEEEKDGHPVQILLLDRLVHSYTSLDDPTRLVYDYERAYSEMASYQALGGRQLSALFIGGGGYTFPRYMEAVYPDSIVDVIEIDPGVTEIAYDRLGLDRETSIVSYNEDARLHLARTPTRAYGLVFGDAFNDFSVPYHLTTHEFNERVRAWLAEDGYYVVNIIDGAGGRFLRAYANTLRQTFAHVYVSPSAASWRKASRSTFVLIAGNTPLDEPALAASRPLAGPDHARLAQQLLTQDALDALLAETRPVTLTDRFAPVDQLLAAVFLERIPN